MPYVLLISVLLLAGILGDGIMGRVDRFLTKHVGEEEETDEPEKAESS